MTMFDNLLELNSQNENYIGPFLDSENTEPQDLGTFSAESKQQTIVMSNPRDDDIILQPDFPGVICRSSSLSSDGVEELLGKADVRVDTEDKLLTGGIQLRQGKSSDPGNSKGKALDLGTLSDNFNIQESVGKKDKRDFYKLTVEEQTEVEIKLTGLTANADVYLLPQKGKVIDKSKNGGKKDEEISATLEPGIYYFRVQPRNNRIKNADYNFDLEIVESADPGNSKGKALDLGTLRDNFNIEESLGKSDRKDFYKFQIDSEQEVKIELTDLEGNADLYLYKSKGKPIDKSKKGGKQDELIDGSLEERTYYLEVRTRNKKVNTDYTLNFEVEEVATKPGSDLERFEFTYYYKGNKDQKKQDFYNGYVYAPTGTYKVGSYFDFNEEDNQSGANGKYYISDSSAAEEDAQEGEVYLETYYDVENRKSYIPYYTSGGIASGTEGLGSEEDFIDAEFDAEEDAVSLSSQAFFGADNYVADIVSEARISKSGDYQIDALLSGFKWGTDEITYSFYDDSNGGQYYGPERNVGEVSEKVKENLRHILENIYEPLLDVDFVEVADSSSSYGLIRIMKSSGPNYAYASYPFADDSNTGNSLDKAGDVHLKLKYDGGGGTNNFQGGPGTHGYLTLIHELGHAVGLKHPGKYSKKDTPPFLPEAEDNTRNTVMSYNVDFKAETLMPYDVKALQFIYGADGFRFAAKKTAYTDNFTVSKGWATQDKYPRHLADVNGDGRADIVAFPGYDVVVALGKGDGTFAPDKNTSSKDFLSNGEAWNTQDKYPRQVADVNGDGRADIVGFSQDAVYVALGKANGTFAPQKTAYTDNFTVNTGWATQDKYPRHLADVNGDGRADIVAFPGYDVVVALGKTDGTFEPYKNTSSKDFLSNGEAWNTQNKYPRQLADVNGDGRADIVGFSQDAVYVALGKPNGTFAPQKTAYTDNFTVNTGWATQDKYPRHLADVNGDGRADIVAFPGYDVVVALGKTDGTFEPYKNTSSKDFLSNGEAWNTQDKYPRQVADVNGDGRADIVGFSQDAVYVANG